MLVTSSCLEQVCPTRCGPTVILKSHSNRSALSVVLAKLLSNGGLRVDCDDVAIHVHRATVLNSYTAIHLAHFLVCCSFRGSCRSNRRRQKRPVSQNWYRVALTCPRDSPGLSPPKPRPHYRLAEELKARAQPGADLARLFLRLIAPLGPALFYWGYAAI